MVDSAEQKRVFLWAVPRSISTAFFRSIMQRDSVAAILEPYSNPFYYGPERMSSRYECERINDEETFTNVKAMLEEPYADKQLVFVKDMAYYLRSRMNDMSALPKGYQHTFLIRDPYKTVKSLFKMSIAYEVTGWTYFDPLEAGFQELWDLFQLISSQPGQTPIVIDADDLLGAPEEMLDQYCQLIGVRFDEKMLSWTEDPTLKSAIFRQWLPWFEGALTSAGFIKPTRRLFRRKSSEELPREVLSCINDCLVYYEKLSNYKITL